MNINFSKNIVIIGGGPCGLGAARRLQDLGHAKFKIFEKNYQMGGLSRSFTDAKGFTWDIGGHVLFSHYPYFDNLMDSLLNKDEWITHKREAWIWFRDRFVPYPFQNNIKHLDKRNREYCIKGLNNTYIDEPINFKEWIIKTFGLGIANLFLIPYNTKVWAYPLDIMSFSWIGDRVSTVNMKKITNSKADTSWGPNNMFRYPARGGTGAIWMKLADSLAESVRFSNYEVVDIDIKNRLITFKSGHIEKYDILINTMPLDLLMKKSHLADQLKPELVYSSVHVIGIGVKGVPPKFLKSKCWIYFPDSDIPFYRATIFSNYSVNNVPDHNKYWSILLEVSESPFRKIDLSGLKKDVVKNLIKIKYIKSADSIVDYWYHYEQYGYPTPTVNRDQTLNILKVLEKHDIYSRGRFGAWKYEVGNQDHSLMQGVEVIDKLLLNQKETTVWFPKQINKR